MALEIKMTCENVDAHWRQMAKPIFAATNPLSARNAQKN